MKVTESQHDRELERYLQGGDPLSRAYDPLREEMPSAALDRAVLANARAALARKRHLPRWPAYAAIAATVVLSVAVVLRLGIGTDGSGPRQSAAPPAALPGSGARESAPAASPYALPPGSAPTPAAEEPHAAPPATDILEALPAVRSASERNAKPMQPELKKEVLEKRSGPQVLRQNSNEAISAVGGGTSPKARISTDSALPAAPAAASPQPASKRSESPGNTRSDQGITAAIATQSVESSADVPAPDVWLKRIEELRVAGRNEEARREMKRFLEKYPDYFQNSEVRPTK